MFVNNMFVNCVLCFIWNHLNFLENIQRIKYKNDEGLSFCFKSISDAADVVDLPGQLHWNTIPQHLFSVEIVPICCGDLIFLPRNIAASFGPNIGSIVICTRVAKTFTLLDPFTLTHCFLKARQYFHAPFLPSFSRPHLVEYVVLGIDESEVEEKKKLKFGDSVDKDEDSDPYAYAAVNDAAAKKYRLANAVVTPVKHNGSIFPIKTHLGRILKPGDHALGYDLLAAGVGPILITKISYAKEENGRVVAVKDKWESDYQLFLKDLQQDPQLLFNRRAIYRNPTNCHPSGLLLRSPFYRPFYPFEDLLHG